jgi:hypothetical protein
MFGKIKSFGLFEYIVTFLVAVALILCYYGLRSYFEERWMTSYGQSHAFSRQKNSLQNVIMDLKMQLIENPHALTNVVPGTVYLGSQIREVFHDITQGNQGLRWRSLIDNWDNPIKFLFEAYGTNTQSLKVTIWSTGSNGIDVHGKGDDIVASEILQGA